MKPPSALAHEAAVRIGNYCSTRFHVSGTDSDVHPMLDIPWFAEAIQKAIDEGMEKAADTDWRQRLRDFAEDSEQHAISRKAWKALAWKALRGDGVTLYSDADYFTAYYDDAAVLWGAADDDHPMFHVQVQSDPPSRCCIHAMHLAVWVQHLAACAVPVLIVGRPEME